MKNAAALLLVIAFVLTGCAGAVHSRLSDRLKTSTPKDIAVLPVLWDEGAGGENNDVGYLFRTMAMQTLVSMNYTVQPLEETDEKYLELGSAAFGALTPRQAATELGADSVLFIHITEWNTQQLLTYASLKVGARFELFASDGAMLWTADYASKESDLRLETESMELAVIKAYEPHIHRFVDAVFTTLPKAEPQQRSKRFFDWLP